MTCNHETFKCTNGVFSCLKCGAVIPNPYEGKATPAPAETAPEPEEPQQEAPKKTRKTKTKKEDTQ